MSESATASSSSAPVSEPSSPPSPPSTLPTEEGRRSPITMIVMGMAGSGKTTFMQRLNAHMHMNNKPVYVINMDPAVHYLPYGANIDIRDTVDYKEVMKQYGLGPNGGILTSLNLFATRFDQVLELAEKRANEVEYILLDTPGQIEVFSWSASGQIITEALASSFPTVIVYVIDTPRSATPNTFMSNMLYACSILYKTRLPFVVVFNKVDVVSHLFASEWMSDLDSFLDALQAETSYLSSLTRSMALVLEEFYQNLRCVGVSAVTGVGMEDLLDAVQGAAEEYHSSYLPDLKLRRKQREEREQKAREESLKQFEKEVTEEEGKRPVVSHPRKARTFQRTDEDEEESESDYEEEGEEEEEDEEEQVEYETLMKYLGKSSLQ